MRILAISSHSALFDRADSVPASDCLPTILTVMWFSSSCLCKAATELVLFFSLTGITVPVRAEAAIATNQAAEAQGITTADSRIHYVIGIGSALLIGIILGNVSISGVVRNASKEN